MKKYVSIVGILKKIMKVLIVINVGKQSKREQVKLVKENIREELIEELTRLLIKQDFYDKENNVDTYVKKTRIYKDLIKLVKML